MRSNTIRSLSIRPTLPSTRRASVSSPLHRPTLTRSSSFFQFPVTKIQPSFTRLLPNYRCKYSTSDSPKTKNTSNGNPLKNQLNKYHGQLSDKNVNQQEGQKQWVMGEEGLGNIDLDIIAEKPDGSLKVRIKYLDNRIYVGDVNQNAERDGIGELSFGDGTKYVGQWKNNLQHGRGTWTGENNTFYEGEWKDGDIHGYGIFMTDRGAKYEGQFENNERSGNGVYYYADGKQVYSGEWKNNRQNGRGILTYSNGDRYDGTWKDGKQDGKGVIYLKQGGKHESEWREGKVVGKGTYTSLTGFILDAEPEQIIE